MCRVAYQYKIAASEVVEPLASVLRKQLKLDFLNRDSGEDLMLLPQSRSWFLLPIAAAAGIVLLVLCTRSLSLRAQFLVLLTMGVSISFLLLVIVQLPEYRPWLEILLVLIVFMTSPIAVRIFLRGLTEEEDEQADEIHKHES